MANSDLTRRAFLQAAAVAGFSLPLGGYAQEIVERGLFTERDVPFACDELLKLLNDERRAAGLNVLELDPLACRVATEHARDMATGHFISHWGSDGRKPYHRFAFAGGTAATQENAASADGVQSLAAPGILDAGAPVDREHVRRSLGGERRRRARGGHS